MARPIIHRSNPYQGLDHLYSILFLLIFLSNDTKLIKRYKSSPIDYLNTVIFAFTITATQFAG